MRWYALVSLMVDSRVKFLLAFVVIAIMFAVVLTLIELRLKRKKEKTTVKVADKSSTDKMRRFLKSNKTPREKLDFIDKTAKEYFNVTYGTSLHVNYSTLINEFTKRDTENKNISPEKEASKKTLASVSKNEIAFCRTMFATYYSDKALSNQRLNAIAYLLIDMGKQRRKPDDDHKVSPYVKKVDEIFSKAISTIGMRKTKVGKNSAGWVEKIVGKGWKIMVTDNKKYSKSKNEERARVLLKQRKLEFLEKKRMIVKKNKALEKMHMARRKVALKTERVRKEKIRKQTLIFQKRAHRELAEIKKRKVVLWKVAKQDAIVRKKVIEEKRKEMERQKRIMEKVHKKKKELRASVSRETITKIEKGNYETSKIKSFVKNIGMSAKKKRHMFLKEKKRKVEKNHLEIVTKHIEMKRKEALRVASIKAKKARKRTVAKRIENSKIEKRVANKRARKRKKKEQIAKVKSSIENISISFRKRKRALLRKRRARIEQNRVRVVARRREVKRKQDLKAIVKPVAKKVIKVAPMGDDIDRFFNRDKYTELEKKKNKSKEESVKQFVENKFSKLKKEKVLQDVYNKVVVKKDNEFFNKEKRVVPRWSKKSKVKKPEKIFIAKPEVVEPKEEGIAERIIRLEKIRLESEGMRNMEF